MNMTLTPCTDTELHNLAASNGRACPVCQPKSLTTGERRQAKRDDARIAKAEGRG